MFADAANASAPTIAATVAVFDVVCIDAAVCSGVLEPLPDGRLGSVVAGLRIASRAGA